jgi:hypothetical protein
MRYVSNKGSVEEQLSAKIREQLVAKAVEYERIMDDMMTEPKSGRVYRSGKTGTHRASAPGEAPGIWFAFLRKGIRHVVQQIDKMRWSVQVGVIEESGRAEISKMLEFGTSRMLPRPMWRAALAILTGRMAAK